MIYLNTATGSLDHTCIALMICEKLIKNKCQMWLMKIIRILTLVGLWADSWTKDPQYIKY